MLEARLNASMNILRFANEVVNCDMGNGSKAKFPVAAAVAAGVGLAGDFFGLFVFCFTALLLVDTAVAVAVPVAVVVLKMP